MNIIQKLFWEHEKKNFSRFMGSAFSSWFYNSDQASLSTYYKLYRKNSDLRRTVEEKQQTAGKGGFHVKIGFGENERIIEDEKVFASLNRNRPFDELKSIIIRDLEIAGNVYLEKIMNPNGQVIWFSPLDPRTINIVANAQGEIQKYMQITTGKTVEFKPEEILHYKDQVDPDAELIGISKVETLIYDILGDSEASKSNYVLFQNNAIPASIIVLEDDLDPDEAKIAIDQLKLQFAGGHNRHKISAMNGIKDIRNVAQSNKDMEFLEQRKFTTERICAVMGVPKVILNYTDGVNYTNAEVQYRKFIENTIRPLESRLEWIFSDMISYIMDDARLEFVDDHINDMSEKSKYIQDLIGSGLMTINEGREELGMERYDMEEADKPIIKNQFVQVEDLGVEILPPSES